MWSVPWCLSSFILDMWWLTSKYQTYSWENDRWDSDYLLHYVDHLSKLTFTCGILFLMHGRSLLTQGTQWYLSTTQTRFPNWGSSNLGICKKWCSLKVCKKIFKASRPWAFPADGKVEDTGLTWVSYVHLSALRWSGLTRCQSRSVATLFEMCQC